MSTTHMVLKKFRERKGMALLFNYRDNLMILLQVSSWLPVNGVCI